MKHRVATGSLPLLRVTTREEWRAWLEQHHDGEREIWLVYAKSHTGLPRVSYDDAVEEALCFGWIDSLICSLDEGAYAQKFTPRRPGSRWSDLNRRRVHKLVAEKRMHEAGRACIPSWVLESEPPAADAPRSPVELPLELERVLRENERAWAEFEKLAPSHRKLYVRWITDGKREETRQQRLGEAMTLLEQGKKLGLGSIPTFMHSGHSTTSTSSDHRLLVVVDGVVQPERRVV